MEWLKVIVVFEQKKSYSYRVYAFTTHPVVRTQMDWASGPPRQTTETNDSMCFYTPQLAGLCRLRPRDQRGCWTSGAASHWPQSALNRWSRPSSDQPRTSGVENPAMDQWQPEPCCVCFNKQTVWLSPFVYLVK